MLQTLVLPNVCKCLHNCSRSLNVWYMAWDFLHIWTTSITNEESTKKHVRDDKENVQCEMKAACMYLLTMLPCRPAVFLYQALSVIFTAFTCTIDHSNLTSGLHSRVMTILILSWTRTSRKKPTSGAPKLLISGAPWCATKSAPLVSVICGAQAVRHR